METINVDGCNPQATPPPPRRTTSTAAARYHHQQQTATTSSSTTAINNNICPPSSPQTRQVRPPRPRQTAPPILAAARCPSSTKARLHLFSPGESADPVGSCTTAVLSHARECFRASCRGTRACDDNPWMMCQTKHRQADGEGGALFVLRAWVGLRLGPGWVLLLLRLVRVREQEAGFK